MDPDSGDSLYLYWNEPDCMLYMYLLLSAHLVFLVYPVQLVHLRHMHLVHLHHVQLHHVSLALHVR